MKIYKHGIEPSQHRQITDMTSHLHIIQDRMTNTLHRIQQQSSIDCNINDLKTCTGDSSDKLNSWLLSAEKQQNSAETNLKLISFPPSYAMKR